MFKVVAAPKALIVVAAVLNNEKVVLAVVTEVTKSGEVPKTAKPVPVAFVSEVSNFNEVMLAASVPYNVPVKGSVTTVVFNPFMVIGTDPVVNELLNVTVPPKKFTDLFESPISIVSVLSAVIAVTFAIFILYAVAVLFTPNEVNIVIAPPVIVGEVPNTAAPDPVSSVKAAAKLALDGVAKNVATFVPKPLTPEDIGINPLLTEAQTEPVALYCNQIVVLLGRDKSPFTPVKIASPAAALP